jgi:hypothetical protein
MAKNKGPEGQEGLSLATVQKGHRDKAGMEGGKRKRVEGSEKPD